MVFFGGVNGMWLRVFVLAVSMGWVLCCVVCCANICNMYYLFTYVSTSTFQSGCQLNLRDGLN